MKIFFGVCNPEISFVIVTAISNYISFTVNLQKEKSEQTNCNTSKFILFILGKQHIVLLKCFMNEEKKKKKNPFYSNNLP